MSKTAVRSDVDEFRLGVLWSAWWLHRQHGSDQLAQWLMCESVGRQHLDAMQRLARREGYHFARGFWTEAKRR